MDATKFSFFDLSTSDRGDFPRIIEIALFIIFFSLPLWYLGPIYLHVGTILTPRWVKSTFSFLKKILLIAASNHFAQCCYCIEKLLL